MRTRSLILIMLVLILAASALAQPRTRRVVVSHGRHGGESAFQLAFEAAAALPQGDLGDDFIGTAKGLGAGTGFEIGGRLRYFLASNTSIGPAIHYADFGDWDGSYEEDEQLLGYYVRTTSLRVGMDLQQFLADREASIRPYLTVGLAFHRNRYEDWVEGGGVYESTTNNLGLAAGGGAAFGPMELSAAWVYNPVENRELVDPGADDQFDWSYIVVRAGLSFGR